MRFYKPIISSNSSLIRYGLVPLETTYAGVVWHASASMAIKRHCAPSMPILECLW